MITKAIKKILEYGKEGFYNQENAEKALKIYLIYTFSLTGLIFILLLGMRGLDNSNSILTFFLLGGSVVLLVNIIYLKHTENHVISGYLVLYFFSALMIYLIYSGGIDNTGPLWIFCLPPVSLYLHGLKRGLVELSIFTFIIIILLFYPNPVFLEAEYTFEFKIRMVFSFFLSTFLTSIYGYSREKSSEKMLKIRKDLEFFLRRDELTGLYNRRGYHDKVVNIKSSQGAVLMCDIDYFKKVNDTYGHDVGDFTIREVSKCILYNLRKEDIAVRWGGEEFFLFLPELNMDNAYRVSEKIRESLETLTIHYSEKIKINVTMSIGISVVNQENTLQAAIRHADEAMYISKEQGRNKSTKYIEKR